MSTNYQTILLKYSQEKNESIGNTTDLVIDIIHTMNGKLISMDVF